MWIRFPLGTVEAAMKIVSLPPFSVKLAKSSYTDEEKIKEVAATLKMEGLKLSDRDLSMLQEIKSGNMSIGDARAKILSEV